MIAVLKDHQFDYESINDFKGKTIGVRRSATYGDAYESAKNVIFKIEEDNDIIQSLRKLLIHRVDAVIIGPGKFGLSAAINANMELQENKDKFTLLETPFKRDPNYLGFNKKLNTTKVLQDINQALQKAHNEGVYQSIIKKYGN